MWSAVVAVGLCVLALLNGAFAGFRASVGHEARLPDRRANAASAVWGIAVTLVGLVAIATVTLPALASEPTRTARFDELVDAGGYMLAVYLPMAVVTLAAIGAHVFVGNHEVSAAAMTIVLGPITLLRPVVIAAGAALGIASSSEPAVWAGAIVAAAVTIWVGPVVRWLRFRPGVQRRAEVGG